MALFCVQPERPSNKYKSANQKITLANQELAEKFEKNCRSIK